MHELSIAMEILEIVEKEALKHGAGAVRKVRLKVGDLSGVETDSLTFSFDAIKGEKKLAGKADLLIQRTPARIRCKPCGADFEGRSGFIVSCPECEGFDTRLLAGDELEIVDIEID
ncbi:MAG: hydrogenase maturation nickel metallochaperone HypA [bacterium]|nr:hydrogenase maturation nickel metallochaperone HypA [bacterium]MDT8395216.1 hydrogenase maturation nickel metallochaperone HypA [bacterium]